MPAVEASGRSIPLALVHEGERVLQICNACRYCEGFCAVFPAVERRLAFSEPDLGYLANLCHDCGECLDACQYAPPHEFGVDLPRTLAEIRRETYRKYAWPGALGGLFATHGLVLAFGIVGAPAIVLSILALVVDPSVWLSAHADADGSFYQVVPHEVMVGTFSAVGALVVVALLAGLVRFWRESGGATTVSDVRALRRAVSDALTLRYLDAGGPGCAYPNDEPSPARRRYHHLTFYGFALCFAATTVAAVYHNVMGWQAPYPLLSLPVALGCLGGVGLLVGPMGLLGLKRRRDPQRYDRAQAGLDTTFLIMLFLTSLTGFLLLVLRESAAMGVTLSVHLGVVMGLFLAMPYGKFVHGIYRFAALVQNAAEAEHGVPRQ